MPLTSNVHKAILLAGGSGSRLWPLTRAVSKQLLPVYDKPMVYYPLSVLMLAGIRDILLITTPDDLAAYQRLLGNGSQWGLSIRYARQPRPEGLAQAFLIGREFVGHDHCAVMLGDNILYSPNLQHQLQSALQRNLGATIFAFPVKDPQNFGVVTFDDAGQAISLEEKPARPRSNWAVPGLYFYDHQALEIATRLRPSARGELEITDVNRAYLERGQLHVERLDQNVAWFDAGTPDTLLHAAQFVQTNEARQGLRIACIEEIAFLKRWIDGAQLVRLGTAMNNAYGRYLLDVASRATIEPPLPLSPGLPYSAAAYDCTI